MPLRLVSPPMEEPVTLAEAKEHLREDGTDQDERIRDLIRAAREATEEATLRALMTQTWELTLPCFPKGRNPICLERPPVVEVTGIEYVDTAGDLKEVADFRLVADAPALVYPAPGARWPTAQRENPEAVTVSFLAGYGDADYPDPTDIPQPLREAILLGVATRYEHREDVVIGTIVGQLNAIQDLHEQYRWRAPVR